MNFSERLMNLRKEKGLSQEELAEKLDVTRQTISKWELGVSTPEMEKLIQMSNLFGISVDELISKNETNASENRSNLDAAFVGVDEKYAPKNGTTRTETYVKEDAKTKKFMKGYIIFFIIFFVLTLATTIFIFIRIFGGFGNKFKGASDIIEQAQNVIQQDYDEMQKEIDQSKNNIQKEREEAQNIINQSKEKMDEKTKQFEENKNKVEHFQSDTLNEAKNQYDRAANEINNTKLNIQNNYDSLSQQF